MFQTDSEIEIEKARRVGQEWHLKKCGLDVMKERVRNTPEDTALAAHLVVMQERFDEVDARLNATPGGEEAKTFWAPQF